MKAPFPNVTEFVQTSPDTYLGYEGGKNVLLVQRSPRWNGHWRAIALPDYRNVGTSQYRNDLFEWITGRSPADLRIVNQSSRGKP